MDTVVYSLLKYCVRDSCGIHVEIRVTVINGDTLY